MLCGVIIHCLCHVTVVRKMLVIDYISWLFLFVNDVQFLTLLCATAQQRYYHGALFRRPSVCKKFFLSNPQED